LKSFGKLFGNARDRFRPELRERVLEGDLLLSQ